MESMLRLKHQLKMYLNYFSMSASELSRRSGVPKQTISFWLAGGEPRKLDHIRKVAKVFGCTVDNLIFGDGLALERPEVIEQLVPNGISEEWISGLFEIKIRRVNR